MSGKISGSEPTVLLSDVTADGAGAADGPAGSVPLSVESQAAPSAAAASTPARHVFAGRYEILGLVGAGGMGTVYRARDAELDEIVALKLLRREVVDQPGMLDRFRQEVKLARRVTHRNVARTYDIGEHAGEKFMTMEFVDGESLASRLAREGALPLNALVAIASDCCAGLHAAHAAGIVHRDLKPDNVLLATDGRVVLTDFGIARALSDGGRALTVGLALGTPAYMAPEQVEGVRDLDARADLYALGAMLYECLTGERPWSGESVWAVAASRLLQPPPDPRAKRAELSTQAALLVVKCMARRREDRFASAAEVAAALGALTLPTRASGRPGAPPAVAGPLESEGKAICVLPFRNVGKSEDDYLAEGLSDDLVDALSMTPGLKVLARGAVARFRGADKDAREVGRELGVQVVVDGSVRRVTGTLRINARAVSVTDGFQLWAKRFDRAEKDVLAVSDEVANAVAEALTVRRSAPARAAPSDARAVDLYLRARHAYQRGWRDDTTLSITLFEQALALAPDDATILAGYARAQMRRFMFDTEASGAEEAEKKGRQAAERALSLAPYLGETRAALANLKWALGDHVGCARELREAVGIAPSSSDVNELYGRMLLEAGDPAKAVACLSAAVTLEPALELMTGDLMRGRALLGDWAPFDAALEEPPPSGVQASMRHFLLARLAIWRRDPSLAAVLRRRVQPVDFGLKWQVLQVIELLETGRFVEHMAAEIDRWGRLVGRAKRRPVFFRQLAAELNAFAGDQTRVLRALEDADGLGLIDVTWVDRCPLFESVRGEPAFRAVRDRIAARAKETLDVLEGRIP
jgi:serine/threonine-protein kinase